MPRNRQIVLASRPEGIPHAENFQVVDTPLLQVDDGQVLIRDSLLGLAPASRRRMGEAASYYVGLLDLAGPKRGETVVVSAASGGVGAMVGQIARLKGCRVVGIAGGPAKAAHVVEVLDFDADIDYRAPGFATRLSDACPDGVHIYFDNVGGVVRDTAWLLLAQGARVVVCGLISEYSAARQPGPGWFDILAKRLTVRGFIMSDHLHRREDFLRDMGDWYRHGRIHVKEDVSEGFDSIVPAFIRMLSGSNFGKTVVKL